MTVISRVKAKKSSVAREITWKNDEITGVNADSFLRWATDELAGDVEKLTIDMSRVEYVNLAGLSSMLRVSRLASYKGVRVYWRSLNKNVANLVRLAGLNSIIRKG